MVKCFNELKLLTRKNQIGREIFRSKLLDKVASGFRAWKAFTNKRIEHKLKIQTISDLQAYNKKYLCFKVLYDYKSQQIHWHQEILETTFVEDRKKTLAIVYTKWS